MVTAHSPRAWIPSPTGRTQSPVRATERPSKAGLDAFLQGLRNRLHPAGVTVTTIKPGFVDTRMTYGQPGMFLVAKPEPVGRAIAKAVLKGRRVVYVPWFWRWIMEIIRSIPEFLFKRLKM